MSFLLASLPTAAGSGTEYNLAVRDAETQPDTPSSHLLAIAGIGLGDEQPPVVRVGEVQETAVVVSRSRALSREVHLDRCRADGIPVIIRPSGGGAVVLSPGVLAASVLAPMRSRDGFPEALFKRYVGAVADSLAACGVGPTVMRGVSDLCIGDRKVAGSSLRIWTDRLLFQISVLVNADIGLLDRYLPLPSRMPDYRQGRAHRDFVITLAEAGFTVPMGGLLMQMRGTLRATVEG